MRAISSSVIAWAALLYCLGLGACATPYQELGLIGGVSAHQITADTYRIVSRGNAYTSSTAVADYTLLKAAETTRRVGGTHFIVVSAMDATATGYTTGSIQTHMIGNTATSTYIPPRRYVKPGQDTYIRVINVQPGKAPPRGAISAEEIIHYVGRRVPREAARKSVRRWHA